MVLMQKWPFFQDFLLGNRDQKNVSYDILELKERLSRLTKTTSSQSRKTEIFPNGLTLGFGRIMAIFQTFFREYRPEKCVIRYFITKKRLSTP